MAFSIRLTPEERALAESYAKIHSISVSEAFKRALFERIEDEYDLQIIKDYEQRKKDGALELVDHEQLWKELDIWETILWSMIKSL